MISKGIHSHGDLVATYNCKISGSVIPAAWPAACWRLMAWWIWSWRSVSLGAAGMAVATAARVATRAVLSDIPAIFVVGKIKKVLLISCFLGPLVIDPATRVKVV